MTNTSIELNRIYNQLTAIDAKQQQLKESIAALRPELLLDKILCAYQLALLSELEKVIKLPEPLTNLTDFFKRHWQRIKQGAAFPYTALPRDPVTLLLCDIAKMISLETDKPAINILMPDVCTENLCDDDFPDLTTLDIEIVLINHILSDSKRYLIPRTLLSQHPLIAVGRPPLPNVYYDDSFKEKDYYLNHNEYQRLLHHSKDSLALKEALEHYQTLMSQTNGILIHLEKLIQKLTYNSTAGIGAEELAGEQVYQAILDFFAYYNQLTKKALKKLPPEIHNEIELLKAYSSNIAANQTAGVNTCINRRQSMLRTAINTHHDTLSSIDISEHKKREMLTAVETTFKACQDVLRQLVKADDRQEAHDTIVLTRGILHFLEFTIIINSPADLQSFITLPAEDLAQVLENDKELQQQLLAQLNTIESLVIFTLETPLEQLKVILSILRKDLTSNVVKNAEDVSAWFIALDILRFKLVCQAFESKWSELIKTANDFNIILENLTTEQRTIVYHTQNERLTELIKCGKDLGQYLQFLSVEQFKETIQSLYDLLPEIIVGGKDFYLFFQDLSKEQRTLAYELIQGLLFDKINTAGDFHWIMLFLNEKQRYKESAKLYLRGKLFKLITNGHDLNQILVFLPEFFQESVYIDLKDSLPNLIKNGVDSGFHFGKALQYLTLEQRTEVYLGIKDQLKLLIDDAKNFNGLLEHLNEEQRTEVYRSLKPNIPQLIKNGQDAYSIFEYLDVNQRASIFYRILPNLKSLVKERYDIISLLYFLQHGEINLACDKIKDSIYSDINNVDDLFLDYFYNLKPSQNAIICDIIHDKLPIIISNKTDFMLLLGQISNSSRVFKYLKEKLPEFIATSFEFSQLNAKLPVDSRTEFYNSLKDHIPKLINNRQDFLNVLRYLTPKQKKEVFEACESTMLDLIKNSFDYCNILKFLSPRQRESVFNIYQAKIIDFIRNSKDVYNIFKFSSYKQIDVILSATTNNFSEFIKCYKDFKNVIINVNSTQCKNICHSLTDEMISYLKGNVFSIEQVCSSKQRYAIYEALFDKLHIIIHSSEDFAYVMTNLSPDNKITLYLSFKTKILAWVTGIDPFCDILECLPPKQCSDFCQQLKARIPRMITKSSEFANMLSPLTSEQCQQVCHALSDHLSDVCKNSKDVLKILKHLKPEQRSAVYLALKDHLPSLIHNAVDFGHVLKYLNSEHRTAIYEAIKPNLQYILVKDLSYPVVPNGRWRNYLSYAQLAAIYIDIGKLTCRSILSSVTSTLLRRTIITDTSNPENANDLMDTRLAVLYSPAAKAKKRSYPKASAHGAKRFKPG